MQAGKYLFLFAFVVGLSSLSACTNHFEKGLHKYQEQDYEAAASRWRQAYLKNQSAPAAYNLAALHADGSLGRMDKSAASMWFLRAAQRGHLDAQYQMGSLHFTGDGVQQSITEAVRWWGLAAQRDHADAQYNLGVLLYEGQELPQNIEDGLLWLQLAQENGSQLASAYLANQALNKK